MPFQTPLCPDIPTLGLRVQAYLESVYVGCKQKLAANVSGEAVSCDIEIVPCKMTEQHVYLGVVDYVET